MSFLLLGAGSNRRQAYLDKIINVDRTNLIGYWPMGEGSGGTAIDYSPEGNNGAYTNGELGQPGIGDGRTSYLLDNDDSFNNVYSAGLVADFNGDEGTLATWGRVSGAGVWTDSAVRGIAQLRKDGDNRIYILKNSTNNQIQFVYAAGGTTEIISTAVSSTDWIYLAITWSSAGDVVNTYVNAVAGTPATGLGTWSGDIIAGNCNIGALTTAPANVFDGRVAHAAVWTTPLTAVQIASLAVV